MLDNARRISVHVDCGVHVAIMVGLLQCDREDNDGSGGAGDAFYASMASRKMLVRVLKLLKRLRRKTSDLYAFMWIEGPAFLP